MSKFILIVLLNALLGASCYAMEKSAALKTLDVSNTCKTESDIANAHLVLDYFKNEIWWNIGGQRSLFTDDFVHFHTSVFTGAAEDPEAYKLLFGMKDGNIRNENLVQGWSAVAYTNSREYYHLNFQQIICYGDRVLTTSEFSGLMVRRNDLGEVTHAVKYGSPVTHLMDIESVNGFKRISRYDAILQDNNLGKDARKKLDALTHPAPTSKCENGVKNAKLGLKNSEKPIGVFDLNPLGKKPNPYKYDPSLDEQPLITCIDPSMTQTYGGIYNEFKLSLEQAGYNEKGEAL